MADVAAKPIIELQHVTKIYPNGTVGLKDIDLNINHGEFVVIVGLSGAGKSTLLRAINRLHDISKGNILIDGESITEARGKSLRNIRRDIGMIFQSFNLVKRASVLRNVLTGRVAYYPATRQRSTSSLKKINKGPMKLYNGLIWQKKFITGRMSSVVGSNSVCRLPEYSARRRRSSWQMNRWLRLIHRQHTK